MSIVAVIDYGLCNLDSITRALQEVGADPFISDDPEAVREADRLVLPGVGAFGEAMANLRSAGMDRAIHEKVKAGAPLLGVCLGMQLLADSGVEFGVHQGLGLIAGRVDRLQPVAKEDRVPHVGWNEVHRRVQDDPLLVGVSPEKDFYFVHSNHFIVRDTEAVVAETPYCGGFISMVRRGHVWGVQFHPEKSQKVGLGLLKNFLDV